MADSKMNWDPKQKRWRAKYRGKWITILAKKLGGKTATETVVAANRYYEKKKAEIDTLLGEKVNVRHHEPEHLDELDSLRITKEKLSSLKDDPVVAKALKIVAKKEKELEEKLNGKAGLSPLDDSLRNPLFLSEKQIEFESESEVFQKLLDEMREIYDRNKSSDEWLAREDYHRYRHFMGMSHDDLVSQLRATHIAASVVGLLPEVSPKKYEELRESLRSIDTPKKRRRIIVALVDQKNLFEMAFKVRAMLARRHSVIEQRKRKTGVIDDHERGLLVQKIQGVIDVPKEKRLSAHLDDYIALQESFVEQGLFGIGQKDQIVVRIKRYKDWAESNGIIDIDVLLSVQHANDYFAHLIGRKKSKEIGAGHGNKLFGTFKNFVLHLAAENILPSVPSWTSRTGNRYRFKADPTVPETISLPILRRLYDSASDEMKLFILLALNCACGQGESGRLRKDEYNPNNGTITHTRSKIKIFENAPTVTYRLWGRTKILLDRQLERQKGYPKLPEHATILILNDEGKPFWEDWEDANGKYHKKDRIAPMFDDLVKEIQQQDEHFPKQTFYKFRATSASAIYNKKEFNVFHGLWLAHTPKTTAEKFYVNPDPTILDECLAWLETHLFDDTAQT